MKIEYFLLLGIVILIPFIKSFSKEIDFYKYPLRIIYSIGIPFLLFILWDIYAVSKGHWSFNPDYISGVRLFNLPVEEILFFTVIPFCALFSWEVVKYFMRNAR
jgi:lycopene cyclase domain-containing protein